MRLPGLLLMLPATALAQDYAWQWPLALDPAQQPAYRVPLDEAIYAAIHDPLLRDVDVLDARGRRMPASMQSALPVAGTERETVPLRGFRVPGASPPAAEQLRARFDAAGLLVELESGEAKPAASDWLLDLGEDAVQVEALQLLPGTLDGLPWLASLRVEGSADLQHWRTLVPRFDAYLLEEQGRQLSALRVALPASPPRYLRVGWLPGPRQGGLAGVQAERRRVRTDASAPLAWLLLDGETSGDGTEWRFRTPGPLLVERWRLRREDERWLGSVRIDSRNQPEGAWQPRADLVSYRIEVDGLRIEDGDHPLPATRDREWRLRWSGGEAPQRPRLELAYRPDQLLFMAEGEPPYRLVAGSTQARRVDAPTSAALAALRAHKGAGWQPGHARIGERSALAGEAALRGKAGGVDLQRGLLWAVLVAAAASITVMALRLIRGAPPGAG